MYNINLHKVKGLSENSKLSKIFDFISALVLNLLKDILERSKISFIPSFVFSTPGSPCDIPNFTSFHWGPHTKNGEKNMGLKPFNKFRASAESPNAVFTAEHSRSILNGVPNKVITQLGNKISGRAQKK